MDFCDDMAPSDVGLNADRLEAVADFFDKNYIQSGKIPCMATMVSRNGQIVHEDYRGHTELGGDTPINADTIFRIYSMTKPVTAVAAMMLFEEGALRLDHPVSRFIPEFAATQVWVSGDGSDLKTQAPEREITVRDVFTHTSGLTYAFLMQHEVDGMYRREKIGDPGTTLEDLCKQLAAMPLLFSPGERWNYGHSTDVLGRIVEVVSGMTLDTFFRERIFKPLGMVDTDFYVPEDKLHRLMACYMRSPVGDNTIMVDGGGASTLAYKTQPVWLNAGGGLVSTVRDYHRFCLMLLHGGSLEGARLLSPKTVEFMRMNHLPDGQTLKQMGDKTFSEVRTQGSGFGLAGSSVTSVADTMMPGSFGGISWGGLANTFFWIDYEEELIAIQATQMMPTGVFPVRPQFQQLVYAAIEW